MAGYISPKHTSLTLFIRLFQECRLHPSHSMPQLDWRAAYFGESLEPETGVTREGCQETTMKPKSEMSICIEMVE